MLATHRQQAGALLVLFGVMAVLTGWVTAIFALDVGFDTEGDQLVLHMQDDFPYPKPSDDPFLHRMIFFSVPTSLVVLVLAVVFALLSAACFCLFSRWSSPNSARAAKSGCAGSP